MTRHCLRVSAGFDVIVSHRSCCIFLSVATTSGTSNSGKVERTVAAVVVAAVVVATVVAETLARQATTRA